MRLPPLEMLAATAARYGFGTKTPAVLLKRHSMKNIIFFGDSLTAGHGLPAAAKLSPAFSSSASTSSSFLTKPTTTA